MASAYKITHIENKGELEITLSGQLNINHITKIVGEMNSLLNKASNVKIQVKEVDNMDLTFVQMLYAAKNSSKAKGFQLKISMELSEELELLITNAGFHNLNLN